MAKEMTSGNPLSLILKFSAPMIAGNLLQQLYSMCDTIIVGQYVGLSELAGVGSTGSICFLVIGFANGICTGFSIPVSQAFGAGNHKSMRKYIFNALFLAGIISLILTTITLFMSGHILRLMKTPDTIYSYAYDYLFITFAGLSATILYNLSAAILRAIGDSKSPLIFLALASALNIILDLVCILKLNMGVAGAGFATVFSQGVSGILCMIYMYKKYDILRFKKGEIKISIKRDLRLLGIGLPMALQFSITAIGSIVLQSSVNQLGELYVTASTAAMKIHMVFVGPMECIGIAMATYCGQNLGAKKYSRISKGIRTSLCISMIYCVISAVILSIFGGTAALLFDIKEADVLSQVVLYLRINAVFYPTLGLLFIIRNSLQGMGYSVLPMLAGVTEMIARCIICFVFVSRFGYTAACLASPAAWIAADILLVAIYLIKIKEINKKEIVTI